MVAGDVSCQSPPMTSWQSRLRRGDSLRTLGVALRLGAIVLGLVIAALQGSISEEWPLALMLTGLTWLVEHNWQSTDFKRWLPTIELAAVGLLLGVQTPLPAPFLPYLLTAAAASAALVGLSRGLASLGAAAVTLIAAQGLSTGMDRVTSLQLTEWLLLSVLGVLAGSWARAWQKHVRASPSRYETANILLTQLRDVTRELPSGLDEVTTASTLLELIRKEVAYDSATLLRTELDGPPQPLAVVGADSPPWFPERDSWLVRRVDDTSAAAQAMVWIDPRTGSSSSVSGQHRAFRALIPMRLGDARIGLVALQRDTPWTAEQLDRTQEIVEDSALMLDTAFVFGDVRLLATTEERRRLAREIHDGIAQEIAGLAYVVDDIAARETDPALEQDLRTVREELGRVVSELRLSIFELRTAVEPGARLGASMSDYVRQVGARAGMSVHISLDENTARLPADVEVEIMRIVQESVTNARRHSRAKNLWVTLRTNPPGASVRVADDGAGIAKRRQDSYGLEIMQERATRIGGRLDIRSRVGGGTVIDLVVGEPLLQEPPAGQIGTALSDQELPAAVGKSSGRIRSGRTVKTKGA